jgi:hypothetical protein
LLYILVDFPTIFDFDSFSPFFFQSFSFKELLTNVARTSLRTKVRDELADMLTDIIVDSVLTIQRPNEPLDLFMVEVMEMPHKTDLDTQLIKGSLEVVNGLTFFLHTYIRIGYGPRYSPSRHEEESRELLHFDM